MSSKNIKERKRSRLTRKRILDAARKLFNERGTLNITTNHIAAEAGLSPGNLYYHFQDKEEIVRALFAEYFEANDMLWDFGSDGVEGVGKFLESLEASMYLIWDYRFFEREILGLLRSDPELKSSYEETYKRRLGQWMRFARDTASAGILKPPTSPRSLQDLTTAIWLIGQSWIPFLDVTGDPTDPREVERGVGLFLTILDPYLTAKGRRVFKEARTRSALPGKSRELTRTERPEDARP